MQAENKVRHITIISVYICDNNHDDDQEEDDEDGHDKSDEEDKPGQSSSSVPSSQSGLPSHLKIQYLHSFVHVRKIPPQYLENSSSILGKVFLEKQNPGSKAKQHIFQLCFIRTSASSLS